MTSIVFGDPPKFGEVWRDKDSGVVVMWLSATLNDGNAHGRIVVIDNPDDPTKSYWSQSGGVEEAVSWIYIGWERISG